MKKKAEIKFGETFGIIIIVYIMLMVGMIWYNNVNNKKIEELSEKSTDNKAFQKYYYIMNSDLVHKSELGDVDEEFDLVSIQTFANYSKNDGKEYTREKLGESTIIIEIYNKDLERELSPIILYNNTYKSLDGKTKNRDTFKSVIPIVDPINKTTYIGIMSVIVYS